MSNTVYILTEGSPLFGRVSSATDAARVTTFYAYNDKGQLLYEHNTSTEGLYYTYDSLGRTVGVFPLAHGFEGTTVYYYSAVGQESAQYTYDPDTRLLTEIQTATTTYTFEYDCFGNRTAVKAGNNTLAQYIYNDRNGKLKEVRYGTGKTVTYVYDELDRVKETCYNDSDGAAQKYIYAYTTSGAVHSVESTECGRRYDYDYDSKGQLIGYTECGKDANGDYTAQLQNFYTYDEMDRIQYWQGSFNYVVNGTTYLDAVGYWYEYLDYGDTSSTNIGELDELAVLEAGINRETTVSYKYDEFYRLKEKILDTAGALSITTNYAFREAGHKTSMLVSSYISTVSGNSGTTVNSYSYSYDADGNINEIVDGNGKVTRYEYDDLGQLIREDNPYFNATYVYDYDNGGNRTARIVYAYTEDALGDRTSTDVYGYRQGSGWDDQSSVNMYDELGNPAHYNLYSLTWDGRRLVEMNRSSGQSVISFQYNADGIRTSKTVDGVKHTYMLEGSRIVSEAWENNLLIYLYDESGSPIGMQYRNSSYDSHDFDTFYFEKNLLGDIIAVYNEDGEKVLRYTYDAWGNHTMSWYSVMGTDLYAQYNPFRYRGYYYDTETKLYYLQSRYYNPDEGRFLNADGYVNANGDLIGFNMYVYCSNNPVMYVDPLGNEAGVLYGLAALLPFVDGPIPVGDIIAGLLIVGMMVIADPVPVIMVNTPPVIEPFQEEFTPIPVDSVPNTGHLPLPQEKGSNIIADPADIVSVPTIVTSKGDIKKHGLPTQGKIRYVPPKGGVKTAPGGKFIDKFGNVWQPGPSRTADEAFEWDVQLSRQGRAQLGWASRDGRHLNVSLKGRITHK